jgi:hypothetical protein
VARSELAATSIENMAIFAGGTMAGELEIIALILGNILPYYCVPLPA